MVDNLFLNGGLLLFILLLMARLQPAVILQPPQRTQILMGLTGGVVSAIVLVALHLSKPALAVVPYPTVTAFMGLYFGPLSALICAALALLPLLWFDQAAWLASCVLVAATLGLAHLWRHWDNRHALSPWVSMLGLALTLPPVASVSLWSTGVTPSATSLGDWVAHWPWSHMVGIVVLGGGRMVLAGKALSTAALIEARSALEEQSVKLRLAFDSLGGGRWEWQIANRSFHCAGRFYEAFGLADVDADAPDRWARWYARRHPLDAQRNADKLARAMDGLEDAYEAEFRVMNTAGEWRWVMSRGTVSRRDAQGRPAALIGMDVDITAHRVVEDALRSAEAKYTTFYQTLPDPAGISRVSDGCYIDVNPAFCELMGVPHEDVVGRTSTELSIWATEQERTRLVEAFRREGRVDRLPLLARGRGLTIPGLMSARSVLINGEDCFVFIFHDMTEAQRQSDTLRALYNQLEQAGRMARLGAWEDEPGKGLVSWSAMCFEIHGLDPRLPPPPDYIDQHVAAAYREPLRANFRRSIQQREAWSIELEVRHVDGHMMWLRARGEPVIENDRVVKVRGVMQDIDESKRAEQRLRQSEDRFSRIFQLMPYPMGLSRQSDGQYVDINPAWVAMTGIPREEAIGRTAIELGLFGTDDRQRLLTEAHKGGLLVDYEVKLDVRNGSPRTVLQSMRPTEFDGETCWLFSVHDITNRKRDEEQVREREALLSLTLSAAALGLWDWNIQTGLVMGDNRWNEMRGLPVPNGAQTSIESIQWTHAIASDDLDRITAELARHTEYPATPFDATMRVGPAGQPPRWVRNLGKIVGFDDQGRPERMLGVSIDVTPQREQELLLQRMALYDALTGLPNRVLLARKLQECMEQARDHGTQLGVAYLDLDGFKPVNDRLGHDAGDRLLVVVAGRLTRALRPVDCVARLGGDEFVILMPGLASVSEGDRLLERVMESVSAPYTLDTERVVVTASIGYTMFPGDAADADTLLRHADQAMYAAKEAGRNRFHQFDAAQEQATQRMRTEGRQIQDALADAQFTLYLQPKVDMRSGSVVGAEALARWHHPQRGTVGPSEFLPLLEGSELEIRFGEWVVETALTLLEQLLGDELPMPLSINISAEHLQQPGFAPWMADCLAHHPRVPAYLLEIEITESAALYDLLAVTATLEELRAMGITVALDDFGTGYSSLTYLRRLPMDTLKIDQSFVHGMMTDPGDLAIVQGVIGLARSFGYRVIAEGVETIEQGQMLLQLGCTQAQGYCIGLPMPIDAFVDWTALWQTPAGWRRQR